MTLRKGFTLIELLIVVAIIAILAAIAVPNFLEAQIRSKVSRVRADMRSIDTALNSYYVDNNRFPPDRNFAAMHNLQAPFPQNWFIANVGVLTTPIAYMTSLEIKDPFFTQSESASNDPLGPVKSFKYFNTGYGGDYTSDGNWGDFVGATPGIDLLPVAGFVLHSYGPDRSYQGGEWVTAGLDYNLGGTIGVDRLYDPTNGTVSIGDIVRVGGGASDTKRE